MFRIGHGYDVHRFANGRKLILGGVDIPYDKGLLGHSDADVLIHSICDALLGAAALGDIGELFPDNDPSYKDADSLVMLGVVCSLIRSSDYEICNIDSTLILQEPKLLPFIEPIKLNISRVCGIDVGLISVKATTEEGLGFTGEKLGIASHSVALLKRK